MDPYFSPMAHSLASRIATLRCWRLREAARRALAQVDERDLRDAGISPLMAQYEASQPFWRPMRDLRE